MIVLQSFFGIIWLNNSKNDNDDDDDASNFNNETDELRWTVSS